jgi:glycerol-3-phosphate acyltransferase PlsY
MLASLVFAAVVGYLLGSLPFGYLIARAKGVNIFEVGSRNPGATNIRRVLGKGPGRIVFALDALKGAAAAAWGLLAFTGSKVNLTFDGWPAASGQVTGQGWIAVGVAGLAGALLGHSFSCFTKFRGGKGVATSGGGLLVLMPVTLLIGGAVWAAVFYSTRYVSLASILAAAVLPVAAFFLGLPPLLTGLALGIAILVAVRHRGNIGRLLNGTEDKFVKPPVNASSLTS